MFGLKSGTGRLFNKKKIVAAAVFLLFLNYLNAQMDTLQTLPSPLPSPPFPSSEWVGSPVLGLPADPPDYAFQKLSGLAAKNSRIKVYGWVGASYNHSTSQSLNIPEAYCIVPNSFQLDQAVVRFERQPNTVQTEKFDWGFRLSNVYGMDYRYTVAKGWLSDAYFKRNQLYAYDPVETYAMLYFPKVAKGMLLKVGRYISPPDIEAQLAPDNYLFTHSVMFSNDPFTFTGAIAKFKLNRQWQLDLGIHGGNDMAIWTNSSSPNGQVMLRWVSRDNNNSLYGGINSIGPDFRYRNGHDNLKMGAITWCHRFSRRIHMNTEMYYEMEKDAARGGSASYGPVRYGIGGGPGAVIPGLSGAVGFVNYFQLLISGKNKNYISVRNDMLADRQGWRTGYATTYSSHTIGFIHYFTSWIFVRPEIRYDRNWDTSISPYDNGQRKDQFTVSGDLIVRF